MTDKKKEQKDPLDGTWIEEKDEMAVDEDKPWGEVFKPEHKDKPEKKHREDPLEGTWIEEKDEMAVDEDKPWGDVFKSDKNSGK